MLIADDRSNSLQFYTLQYRTDDSNGWIKKISKIPPTRTSYDLTGLQPYTEYIVELYGTNKHFTSDSFQVKVWTSADGELYQFVSTIGCQCLKHLEISCSYTCTFNSTLSILISEYNSNKSFYVVII